MPGMPSFKPHTEVKLQKEVWARVRSACSSSHACLCEALHEISACVHCSVKKNTHLMRGSTEGEGSSLRLVERALDLNSEEFFPL